MWEKSLFLDDGGIYKGRMNHRERVREVDETHDTKTDLPVDYRQVQTIDEENLYGNTGVCKWIYPILSSKFLSDRKRANKTSLFSSAH